MSASDTSMPDMGQQAIADSLYPAPDTSGLPATTTAAPSLVPSGQPTTADFGTDAGEQAPQPSITPQKPSLWRQVLSGALQGLAAGSAVNTRGMSSGSAIAAGAGAGVNQVINVQPQQQAAQQQAALQNAFHHAQLAQIQREMALAPQDKHEQYLDNAASTYNEMLKSGAAVPMTEPTDFASAQKNYQQLTLKNPALTYSIMPTGRDADGNFQYSAVQYPNSPTQADITLTDPDGNTATIPAGTKSNQIGQVYTNMVSKALDRDSKKSIASQNNAARSNLADKNNAARSDLTDKNNAARAQRAATTATGQNVVAFDPQYQNPDGSKGANVVLDKATAQQRGLFSYKADPSAINANVAGMNDVQTKINQLADVAMDTRRMSQVQPELAAAILEHGKGIKLGISGTEIDTSRINEGLYKEDVAKANQATRDFVTAYIGAHEAITQLPRLQTFGKSSRMTETQLHAALNMLPQSGDDAGLAQQKMTSLQNTIDPLRKQMPHMPGAELIPSWHEQQAKPPAATHVYDPTTALLKQIGGAQ